MRKYLLPLFIFLSFHASALSRADLRSQLIQLNKEWINYTSFLDQALPLQFDIKQDADLIQLHLLLAEQLLRDHTPHVIAHLRETRNASLQHLHRYALQKQFPKNTCHPGRRPYFIDVYNTPCAVGYLVIKSGNAGLANTIVNERNYEYIREMNFPALIQWQQSSGFTIDELALIQPTYADDYRKPDPRCGDSSLRYGGMGESLFVKFKGECSENVLHGKWQLWYPGGKLWEEGTFENGKREGMWSTFYSEGGIETQGEYKNDLQEGSWLMFDRKGAVIMKTLYHNGKQDGKAERFSSSGRKTSELYYVDGKPHGYGISWHETGEAEQHKAWEGYYKNGVPDSLWRMWDVRGNLSSLGYYENGLKTGMWTEWYDDDGTGLLRFKGEYVKGIKQGIHEWHIYRDDKGKKVFHAIEYTPYKDGLKNGWVNTVLYNGVKSWETYYVNDTMEGKNIQRYESGATEMIGHWKKGKMDGTWHFYYPDGRNKIYYNIVNGLMLEHTEWDSSGALTMHKTQTPDNLVTTISYETGIMKEEEITSKDGSSITRTFYKNGKVKSRNEFVPGRSNSYTEYYPSGIVKIKGTYDLYERGKKRGKWQYFDEYANLLREENND